MKHPIYKDVAISTLLSMSSSERKKKFKEISMMPDLDKDEVSLLIREYMIAKGIVADGHVLINVIGDDWYNDISEKTFMSMRLQDIMLPYKSAWINLGDEFISYSIMSKEKFIKELDAISTNTNRSSISPNLITINLNDYLLNINTDSTIDEFINTNLIYSNDKEDLEAVKKIKKYLTKFLSIMLYISAFKADKKRVSEKLIKSGKSKKGKVKKHTINTIKLYQIETNTKSKDGSNGWTSNKKWLVRGHWRRQYYRATGEHKPKWIDPFWKGSGSEEVKKIYEVK